ncbi:MAG: hypothetical protein IPG96_03180 [Proteobacteria bacterium]|nr:hypothetical protein [Pseudomonadota bacterium]
MRALQAPPPAPVVAPPAPTPPPRPAAPPAGDLKSAREEGWNSPWGLLLSLNNIFQSGSVLTTFQGMGAAAFYAINPALMLRFGLSVSRSENPPTITESIRETAGEKITTYSFSTPSNTSNFGLGARADAIWRLSRKVLAPYLGTGLFTTTSHSRQTADDEVSVVDQVTRLRSRSTNVSLGARGLGGAEWRIHPNFAIFAEYELALSFFSWNTSSSSSTVENAANGARTVTHTATNSSRTSWLTGSNTLAQGASLGLIVLF